MPSKSIHYTTPDISYAFEMANTNHLHSIYQPHRFHTKSSESNEPTCALCLTSLSSNSDAKICEKCYKKHNFNQRYSTYAIAAAAAAAAAAVSSASMDSASAIAAETVVEFNCNICHKSLPSGVKLEEHLIEHSFQGCDDRGYTCYICSSVFTSTSGLRQHMANHGPNSRPYDCSHCPAKFFFRAELENHTIEHEAGIIPSGHMVAPPQPSIIASMVVAAATASGSPSRHSVDRTPPRHQDKPDEHSDDREDDADECLDIDERPIKVESHDANDDDDEYIEIEKLVEYPIKGDQDQASVHSDKVVTHNDDDDMDNDQKTDLFYSNESKLHNNNNMNNNNNGTAQSA